jgi:hypothetical protein
MSPFEIIAHPQEDTKNLYSVSMGAVTLHFSYKTLIGVHVFTPGEKSYRVENVWGRLYATGRHFRHFKLCGLDRALVRTERELQEIVRGALFADVVAAPLNHGE